MSIGYGVYVETMTARWNPQATKTIQFSLLKKNIETLAACVDTMYYYDYYYTASCEII